MNVGELRALLDRLPDDMPVIVVSPGCRHITEAEKRSAINARAGKRYWHLPGPVPAQLFLRGYGPLWCDPEPPWELTGRWPKAVPDPELRRLSECGLKEQS